MKCDDESCRRRCPAAVPDRYAGRLRGGGISYRDRTIRATATALSAFHGVRVTR